MGVIRESGGSGYSATWWLNSKESGGNLVALRLLSLSADRCTGKINNQTNKVVDTFLNTPFTRTSIGLVEKHQAMEIVGKFVIDTFENNWCIRFLFFINNWCITYICISVSDLVHCFYSALDTNR